MRVIVQLNRLTAFCIGTGATAVLAITLPTSGQILREPAIFYEAVGDNTGKIAWPDLTGAQQPGRVEGAHTTTIPDSYYRGFERVEVSKHISMSGYVETFGGALPNIQFSLESSTSGPANVPVSAFAGHPDGAVVSGRIDYYVDAVPAPGTPLPQLIPLEIRASGGIGGTIAQTATANGNVGVYIYDTARVLAGEELWVASSSASGPADGSIFQEGFDDKTVIQATKGAIRVIMAAQARVTVSGDPLENKYGSGQITGWVDPIIRIDPAWEFADQFHLRYSEGIEQYFAPGDLDRDGVLSVNDLDSLTTAILLQQNDRQFDLDGDAVVGLSDRDFWIVDLKQTWFGDANLDGEFNSGDLVDVLAAGEYEDAIPLNSGWAEGDWDGNGDFESVDLVTALSDGGYEQGPRPSVNAVPEPTGIVMLMTASLLLLVSSTHRRGRGC